MNPLLSRTGLSLAIRLLGIAINFFALLVLARAIEPADLGLWAWAGELVALLCVLSAAGFNMIAIRVVPDCLIARDRAGLRRFVRGGLVAGLVGSAAGSVLLLLGWRVGWLVTGVDAATIALMAAVLLAFTALRFAQEVMRGAGHLVLAQVGEQLLWPSALLAVALVLWLMPQGYAAVPLLLGAQLVVFAACAIVLLAVSERVVANISLPASLPPVSAKRWLAGGIPLALSAALSVFLKRGDMIALGALGDAREVAYYAPASRYAALLVLGQAAASMASAARMREWWRLGQRAPLQNCLDQMAAISVLFALPLAAVFWIAPGTFLGLFGPDFASAAPVLQLLVAAQMINCWTGPVACAVVACDLERVFAFANAAAAALLLVLLALLVPRFGMVGAAAASLAGIAALNLSMVWVVWRRTGLACWARFAGLAALSGALPKAAAR